GPPINETYIGRQIVDRHTDDKIDKQADSHINGHMTDRQIGTHAGRQVGHLKTRPQRKHGFCDRPDLYQIISMTKVKRDVESAQTIQKQRDRPHKLDNRRPQTADVFHQVTMSIGDALCCENCVGRLVVARTLPTTNARETCTLHYDDLHMV
ncbi:unnamed protein product, partial [Protopolystoma xenopodis]